MDQSGFIQPLFDPVSSQLDTLETLSMSADHYQTRILRQPIDIGVNKTFLIEAG
jgi:hypothetical protein